ncbi:hypothetical protein MKMG_01563 [Methanogenium sp. MK-MG]|nr:hypothetical protein MKMG_01563 [Methanogenium sp. MK-MG]
MIYSFCHALIYTDHQIHLVWQRFLYMASPLLALIFSFFIPGLGQFYTGQFLKAILLFVVAGVLAFFWFTLIAIPLYLIVWIYGMYDAYTEAQSI